MFPSARSFIVCSFPLSFTTRFGLHGHLQVCRILHIFIYFYTFKDSVPLLFLVRCPFLTWSHSVCFPSVFCSCAVFLRVFFLCFLAYAFVCLLWSFSSIVLRYSYQYTCTLYIISHLCCSGTCPQLTNKRLFSPDSA
jgi:hypothetical protein